MATSSLALQVLEGIIRGHGGKFSVHLRHVTNRTGSIDVSQTGEIITVQTSDRASGKWNPDRSNDVDPLLTSDDLMEYAQKLVDAGVTIIPEGQRVWIEEKLTEDEKLYLWALMRDVMTQIEAEAETKEYLRRTFEEDDDDAQKTIPLPPRRGPRRGPRGVARG